MKSRNLLSVSFLILSFFAVTSCEDFLEVAPRNNASDERTIVDKASAETAVRGMYRTLADDGYYGRTFQFAIYLQGGELEWGDSRTVNLQFIQHDVRSDNEEVARAWSTIYQTINQANHIIEKVPSINDVNLTESLKNQLLGEAYFVRALAYFDLARTWGGVQIILKPTKTPYDTKGIQRSTLAQTYQQVLSDLIKAEELLPEITNRIRATRKTVWALRARYHLYQKEWADAALYASKLIEDDSYTLVKPYSAFFANNVVATQESVFETAYSANYPNDHRTSWQPQSNGGVRRWFPNTAFVNAVTDPEQGGNRSALVGVTSDGRWYGNLYYRNPAVDPSYVIRIAELYLIRAEALAQSDDPEGALNDLNEIRDRAGLSPSSATTKEEILLAIENERRFEFAFEPHRWFDLVRTRRVDEVLGIQDERKYVLPIPIVETLVDKDLQQNPGY